MSISDLVFSDLFVAQQNADCWYKPTPDSLRCEEVPPEHYQELETFRKHLHDQTRQDDFSVIWGVQGRQDSDKMPLRVRRMRAAGNKVIYVCRRWKLPPGGLRSLGVPIPICTRLLATNPPPGLYVFLGRTGAGKTTTAASYVLEQLQKFGGVCWTVESPRELVLPNKIGLGRCYQTEVDTDDDVGGAVRNMMRATPNIIFIGEVRGRAACREAINAATSGHIVVTTFHAGDLLSGLSRLSSLAGDENAQSALADAFQFGMHLSLYNADPSSIPSNAFTAAGAKGTGTPPRILSVQPLWRSESNSAALAAALRKGEAHQLANEVMQQRRMLMNGPLPS